VTWILPEGAQLNFAGLCEPIRILRGLGGGTQGQVFAVETGGEQLAIKWYLPACIARDRHLERRLLESIRLGPPNDNFLWPIALLRPSPETARRIRLPQAGFGYLMALRPTGFVGAHDHAAGSLEISLRNVLRAAFFLADAFHALHLKGLCYKDISLGNLFLEPSSGRILICDNDNVDVDGRDLGSVLGTPGFMAPEILLGQARPGADSDLFSLAVLIFRLLTRHDPFKGQLELAIRCLDEPARRRLYGEDPVFIFDPGDGRNRPDPIEHAAALITWPIYPERIKALFEQTFCSGLKQPSRRTLTGQWKQAISQSLDQRRLCPRCQQEAFPEAGAMATCWSCGSPLAAALSLQLPCGQVAVAADNELYPHHFDNLLSPSLDTPLARLVAHPGNPAIVGLRNLSHAPWRAELSDGQSVTVPPGKTCNLSALLRLSTAHGPITLVR
jgi:serine/threonine protein kinase